MRRLLAAALAAGAALGGATPAAAADQASLVDPLIGTGGDAGHTFPGAVVPFGMVQLSPVSARTASPGGYRYDDPTVRGFGLTRLSGAGCANQGAVPIMPLRAPFAQLPVPHATFSHRQERASPGRYSVRLGTGIDVDLAATKRTGIAALRFPARTAYLAIDAGGGATDQSAVSISVTGRSRIEGRATDAGFCGGPSSPTTYFVVRFDRPITTVGTWGEDGVVQPDVGTSTAVNSAGALLGFRLPAGRTLRARIGVSHVSVGGAEANLRAEGKSWNAGAVAARGRAAWNRALDRIGVEGGTPAQRRTFATALYHSLIHPSTSSDVDSRYRGRDGAVHTARGYTRYTNISGWDVYRTQIPLLALLQPRVASDVIRSLVEGAAESGSAAKWELGGGEAGIMVGDPAPFIVATAWAFGARRFDAVTAFAALARSATTPRPGPYVYPSHGVPLDGARWGDFVARPGLDAYIALGYVPLDHGAGFIWGPAATTLEYTLADFALGRFARETGRIAEGAALSERAANWRRLFNPATGYLEPRLADGSFPRPFSHTAENGFVEGNSTQYTWFVPHDVAGLARLLGGERAAIARLDRFHADLDATHLAPHAWLGNEPSFGTPWLYNWLGAPWRTQATVRRAVDTLFRPLPAGLPGDDDLGALSAWYVWSALGLYPAIPGVGGLTIGSPLFPRVTINSGLGRLRIDASGARSARPYVRALQLDGRPYARAWLPVSGIRGNRTLRFELSASPERRWGASKGARPPSFPRG